MNAILIYYNVIVVLNIFNNYLSLLLNLNTYKLQSITYIPNMLNTLK